MEKQEIRKGQIWISLAFPYQVIILIVRESEFCFGWDVVSYHPSVKRFHLNTWRRTEEIHKNYQLIAKVELSGERKYHDK